MTHSELFALPMFADFGPGKFSCRGDEMIWSASMDGPDDQCGESESDTYACLMYGPFEGFPAELIGAICREQSQGFVSVTYYLSGDERDMARDWKRACRDADMYASDQTCSACEGCD